MSKFADPANPFGYASMSAPELRKTIVDLVRQNVELAEDKREYTSSINTLVKENSRKIVNALEVLKTAAPEA